MNLVGLIRVDQIPLALCLTLLAACTSLPTIVPEVARGHAAPARIDGTQGPPSAERSKAILNGLKSKGTETNIFDVHLAVDEAIVDTPLTAGNKVELLQDGSATYKAMISAVSVARDNINTGTYILGDDEVAQRFVTALIAKQ